MSARPHTGRDSQRPLPPVIVRQTQPKDFDPIIAMARRIYPSDYPYAPDDLYSQVDIFPEGQLVAVDAETDQVLGMAASLMVRWDDYDLDTSWYQFTDNGKFTNHDPQGRTLYGADIMVDPAVQGRGIGKTIYAARRELCRSLKLKRIRAGARLTGYSQYADRLGPVDYVLKIIEREIGDPTLSFQLKQRFRVIGVVSDYLEEDPASRGCAALIEWINHDVATKKDYAMRDPRFAKHFPQHPPGQTG